MTAATAPPPRVRHWPRTVIVCVVIAIVVAAGATWYWQANRKGVKFSAVFTSSVGVYPGSDVRILGVPVGTIDSIKPDGKFVKMGLNLDPGVDVKAATWAVIISPNLVSDRYVQLTGAYPKHSSAAKLRTGDTIPHSRTKTPVEVDDLYKSLTELADALGPNGANKNGALSRLLDTGAANLKGNGSDFNTAITNFAKASGALADSKDDIFSTISNLSQFTTMLKQNNSGLVQVNSELASVSQTLANDRVTFGQAMHELSIALGLVQKFVQANRSALTSNVTKLDTVAKTLATERDSLLKALSSAPLLVQNFINAYDPKHNLIRGRGDLNELTVWADNAAAGSVTSSSSVTGGPPTLLPPANASGGRS